MDPAASLAIPLTRLTPPQPLPGRGQEPIKATGPSPGPPDPADRPWAVTRGHLVRIPIRLDGLLIPAIGHPQVPPEAADRQTAVTILPLAGIAIRRGDGALIQVPGVPQAPPEPADRPWALPRLRPGRGSLIVLRAQPRETRGLAPIAKTMGAPSLGLPPMGQGAASMVMLL
jgi:hypothetical protein